MQIRNYLCFIFIVLTLFNCSNNKPRKQNKDVKNIEKTTVTPGITTNDNIPASKLFEKIRYIPVETTDSFLIGHIDKILILDNKFILVDKYKTHSVFIIDSAGRKISQINKRGNGPGEYHTISDVSIDYQNNEIIIWSDILQKIMNYDLNGNFKSETKIDVYGSRVQKFSDNRFTFYSLFSPNKTLIDKSMYPNILLTDVNSRAIETADYFPSVYIKKNLFTFRREFSRPDIDTVSIIPDHSNIIYYISKNNIVPRYYIDFGDNTINTDDYWTKMADPSYSKGNIEEYYEKNYCMVMNYKESDRYIYFCYKFNDKYCNIIFSKETKEQIHYEYLENDTDIRGTATNPIYMEGNRLYGIVSPEVLIDLGRQNPKYKQYSEVLDETDNSIIVELTLRDY